ncbi:MAG: hypothetical protein DWQ31_21265 [Planctomycetota bacterium]|nr:MAG: hypothetical protein DWQ31_21265 [Planctomycetota bacterium]REJ93636.1 MAG: hypothetical protein DWQ35_09800 [Planctomycetota bacterium]REK25685.1 MAG: hypothetical protein DWQ42_10540 [Planctomycetota bacterium]REK46569.1 MAG: hypothetical protein DWQ46_06765 [Planctomycetota bacterium]
MLKYCYLAYLAKPVAERSLYRLVRRHRVRRIVELGVGDTSRAQRLIQVAGRYHEPQDVAYAGIDLFEARPNEQAPLSLKSAYRQMTPLGARLQLIPGDPYSALARAANSLTKTDLLLVAADQDLESLRHAWFYVPRMLHENSQVLAEKVTADDEGEHRHYEVVSQAEISRWADDAAPRRAA